MAGLEIIACNRMAKEAAFADLRVEPAAGSQRDIFLQVHFRVGQRRQTAQGNVLLDGGNDTLAEATEQRSAQNQRLICRQPPAHARQQIAFLAILAVRAGKDQAHYMSA